ncbi:MAG: 50S ribosomal protein L11 methyltransferase [Lachnospiraceae bacterium]|jgi:ribosomal protein L11 methyltransferase|nr:50S ribosomal protein L11 methyltransferase [Lachnospiraceae bacterium]
MKWHKITIKTITDAEDIIICYMEDIGLEGAQIEDKIPLTPLEKEKMFVDIPPVSEEDDGIAYLNFFVEDEEGLNIDEIVENVKTELEAIRDFTDIGEGSVMLSETEDLDWINNWKKYFHQFYIDDLLVIPSWEEIENPEHTGKILHIDPGTAFGTGAHETTQLCIRQIKKFVNENTEILDVGCGSGILGIVALMYGAKHAKGTDLDPCAIDASAENLANNGISPEDFEIIIGNIISDKEVQDWAGYEKYDIVVANILHNVLDVLTPVILHQLKPGGIYITSGIIDEKEGFMLDVMKRDGLEVLDVTRQGEWVSITARKPE